MAKQPPKKARAKAKKKATPKKARSARKVARPRNPTTPKQVVRPRRTPSVAARKSSAVNDEVFDISPWGGISSGAGKPEVASRVSAIQDSAIRETGAGAQSREPTMPSAPETPPTGRVAPSRERTEQPMAGKLPGYVNPWADTPAPPARSPQPAQPSRPPQPEQSTSTISQGGTPWQNPVTGTTASTPQDSAPQVPRHNTEFPSQPELMAKDIQPAQTKQPTRAVPQGETPWQEAAAPAADAQPTTPEATPQTSRPNTVHPSRPAQSAQGGRPSEAIQPNQPAPQSTNPWQEAATPTTNTSPPEQSVPRRPSSEPATEATTPWREGPAGPAADAPVSPQVSPQATPTGTPQPTKPTAPQPSRADQEKTTSEGMSAPHSEEPPTQGTRRQEIAVENLAVGVVHVLGDGLSAVVGGSKSILGAGVSTIAGLSKTDKQTLPTGTIPVESLSNGIINAAGDGVEVVVEKSKTTGTYVISKMQDMAPVAATALLYEFKGEIAGKLFGKKK